MFSTDELLVLISMGFSFLVLLAIGGFILLFPIARRLGHVMEEWLRVRQSGESPATAALVSDIGALKRMVASIDARLDTIADRQEFYESLLDPDERAALAPPADQALARSADR